MKSLKYILMFTLVLTLAGAPAYALPRSGNMMVVNIPFTFSVGGRNFAPGQYAIRRTYDSGICYSIRREDGQRTDHATSATFLISKMQSGRKELRGKLVFQMSEGRRVLAQMWGAGSDTGGKLLGPVVERRGAPAESVTVVAQ